MINLTNEDKINIINEHIENIKNWVEQANQLLIEENNLPNPDIERITKFNRIIDNSVNQIKSLNDLKSTMV